MILREAKMKTRNLIAMTVVLVLLSVTGSAFAQEGDLESASEEPLPVVTTEETTLSEEPATEDLTEEQVSQEAEVSTPNEDVSGTLEPEAYETVSESPAPEQEAVLPESEPGQAEISLDESSETLSALMTGSPAVVEETPTFKIPKIALNEIVPAFSLPDALGGVFQVPEDVQAQLVLLTFFRGAWDPYAQEQLKAIAQKNDAIEGMGAQVIAISGDSADALAALRKKELYPFPILVDETFDIGRGFGVFRPEMKELYPACFILDNEGRILFFQRGSTGPETLKIDQLIMTLESVKARMGD